MKSKIQSITHNNDLEELLSYAELTDAEFTAEKGVTIVMKSSAFMLPTRSKDQRRLLERDEGNALPIPLRPTWDGKMTIQELNKQEKAAFVEWRKTIQKFEEDESVLLTPFERNLEVWRQLWRVVEKSHVVIQIVDARDPLLFRSLSLEKHVQSSGKKNMLLVNKADLLTETQRQQWADFFNKASIPFMFWSAATISKEDSEEEQEEDEEEGEEQEEGSEDEEEQESEAQEEKKEEEQEKVEKKEREYSPTHVYARNQLLKRIKSLYTDLVEEGKEVLNVGMVGYPNVGKSSTVNALCNAKRVAVSQTPGKTKHFQTINLSKKMCLIDCPGLVFPSLIASHAEMLLNGLLPVDQMGDPLPPIELMCERIPKVTFELLYGIILPKPRDHEDPNRRPTAQELLQTYAFNRSFMRAGYGTPDESRAARLFIKDYLVGKLLFCHPPPGIDRESDPNASPNPLNLKSAAEATSTKAPPSLLFQSKKINQLENQEFRTRGRQYVADDDKFTGQGEVLAVAKGKMGDKAFTRRKKLLH
eukprot:TRINITY_DN11581_c0_g1_i1.p1 TRINITY_DN11581_c0_g1~~TRINITY_DN11581_c0_g1_i1.p1  ORF type:complete len:571 (+),score=295.70 TRINITY_DN11581_c0_g1_i1:121-1713(+)